MGKVIRLCLHHSAGGSGSVEEFRREHKAKGWSDIGYHAVIGNGHGDADGHVGLGRSEEFEGAGVFGNNAGTLHVCLVGNFETAPPTDEQLRSLGHWSVNRCRRHNRLFQIYGHQELSIPNHGTACPGRWWMGSIIALPGMSEKWRGHKRLVALRAWLEDRFKGRTNLELPDWIRAEGIT